MTKLVERDETTAIYDHTVPARQPWSHVVGAGQVLRIVDLEGQQAVDTVLYNADNTEERYSPQDTLLAQGSAYIGSGTELLSNEGNIMARIEGDTCGLHDTSAGACSCESNTVRFGHRVRYMHACRENFILELGKYGLGKRDLVGNINFFMNVPVRPDGALAIVDGVSQPGGYVELCPEMDVLVVVSNCPQINNPCNGFNPTPIRMLVWDDAGA